MGVSRNPPPVEPVRHRERLDEYVGKWVALVDGKVVEVADSSTQLAYRLEQRQDEVRRAAVMKYIPPASEAVRVGVG